MSGKVKPEDHMGEHKTFIDAHHVCNAITLVEHNTSSITCHLHKLSPMEHSEQRRQYISHPSSCHCADISILYRMEVVCPVMG